MKQEEAGHGHHDRAAGDGNRVPRGRGSGQQRVVRRAARPPLFPLPLEVEQRVVHADRHPDEQDEFGGRSAVGQHVRGDRVEPDRGQDGTHSEKDRDAGREQRAEGQQQNHDSDGQAEHQRGAEVSAQLFVHVGVDRLRSGDVHSQRRVLRGNVGHTVPQWLWVVRAVGEGHLDEHRGAVGRGHRRRDSLDRGESGQRCLDADCRLVQLRLARVPVLGRDQYRFDVMPLQPGGRDHRSRTTRLAGSQLGVRGAVHAGQVAADDADEDEQEPTSNGEHRVSQTPARCPDND